MYSKAKKNKRKISFSLGLLIFAALIFISCGGQKAVEEQAQEGLEYQEKTEKLEQELTAKDEVITELQEKNADLESQLPVPRDVLRGNSHWEIAHDYLTQQKGLSVEEAANKLSDALLYHPILVGFKVWNYFANDTFGSFVTQGSATVSPGTVMKHEKKEAKEEKMGLENQIVNLQSTREDLIQKVDQMEKDYESEKNKLYAQISSLKQDLGEAENNIQNFEERMNSTYYLFGSEQDLKDQDKIKGTFLGICGARIKNVTFSDLQNSIDLRETDSITLSASDAGVSQIKKVRLLPKHLINGEDYRVEIASDHQSARLVLLDKEKVRMAHLIIYIN